MLPYRMSCCNAGVGRWCSLVSQSPSHTVVGHSANITGLAFTFNNMWLITIGGDDSAVFKWRLTSQEDEPDSSKTVWCVLPAT